MSKMFNKIIYGDMTYMYQITFCNVFLNNELTNDIFILSQIYTYTKNTPKVSVEI